MTKHMKIMITITRALTSDIQNSASPKKDTWINCSKAVSDHFTLIRYNGLAGNSRSGR